MPGDKWQKLANLRLLYGYMYGQPGKKLLFMGQEFGQPYEWNHEEELPLYYLDEEGHRGVALWIRDFRLGKKHS
jgi:1,4-alpha-glucan branching enzyme